MVAVTALALLIAAGVRSAPGVLIKPLEQDLGWGRTATSLAASIGLLLCGVGGPLSGWLIERFGPRRLMVGGLVLMGGGLAGAASMTRLSQIDLFWGVLTGLGTGATALV